VKPLAISIGCPAGIGPEVAVRALRSLRVPALLVGDPQLLRALGAPRAAIYGQSASLTAAVVAGKPNRAAGRAQLAWIDQALDLVVSGQCSALVTGPVSKHAIATSGAPGAKRFRGHTEHLAERLGVRDVVMAFASGERAVSLVTTHLPLARVPRAVSAEKVAASSFRLAELVAALGHAKPRIAIAGLNPHAGEGGLLGSEERTAIEPGMRLARRRLARARVRAELVGPIGAESAFRRAANGDFDGVVAMYHDQATIACKLMGFGEMVNVTLGLPIVRTSVDHGTGYDIVGTGRASPAGMRAAIELAARLTRG
jgi:4-hydroxythreonine-4-phosphate dehydrogenase